MIKLSKDKEMIGYVFYVLFLNILGVFLLLI